MIKILLPLTRVYIYFAMQIIFIMIFIVKLFLLNALTSFSYR